MNQAYGNGQANFEIESSEGGLSEFVGVAADGIETELPTSAGEDIGDGREYVTPTYEQQAEIGATVLHSGPAELTTQSVGTSNQLRLHGKVFRSTHQQEILIALSKKARDDSDARAIEAGEDPVRVATNRKTKEKRRFKG